jgi:flagellar biogenesis protein FliO
MEALRQIGAVAGVLLLLGATLWWLRRGTGGLALGRHAATRRLESLERIALGPHETLHLVRVGDLALVVASSPAGCALLRSLPWRRLEGRREVQP